MAKKNKTKSKGKNADDGTEVYDEAEDEEDKKEWVEEKQPDQPGETYTQMPENKPGKAPPDPRDMKPPETTRKKED